MKKKTNGRMKMAVITAMAACLMVCGRPDGNGTVVKAEELSGVEIVCETGTGADPGNDDGQGTGDGKENGGNGEDNFGEKGNTGGNSGDEGVAPCGEEPSRLDKDN